MILDIFKTFIPIFSIAILIFSIIIIMLNMSLYKNFFISYYTVLLSLIFCVIFLFFPNYKIFFSLSKFIIYDNYTRIFLGLLYISGFFTCIFIKYFLNFNYVQKEIFYLFLLISIIGGIIVSLSTHIILFLMGMELLFLPIIGLINCSNTKYTLIISIKYFFVSILTTSFMLLGFAFLYLIYGSLNFSNIFSYFILCNNSVTKVLINISVLFILIPIFFKLSLFPFHFFLRDIYKFTFSPVLIYFTTATKISLILFLTHFLSKIYYLKNYIITYQILFFFIILSIFFGNFLAFFQKNIKIVLSYASISHTGLILMLLLNNSFLNKIFPEFIYSIISYILSTICFFSILSILEYQQDKKKQNIQYHSLKGLFWYHPVFGIIITILLFVFSGFPLTLNFWGKFYLLRFAIKKKLWFLLFSLVYSSFFSIFCYFPFLQNIYLFPEKFNALFFQKTFKISKIYIIMIIFLISTLVFYGFFPNILKF
ncbi:proton-conducting transporter membrane subunit [Buchnera aphidicola]|uniref:NADH-quinone oxidoreductase subunit N n=1 Tax=Buchnera aphidicola subsp. Tuberolachnus salignus TaxID=98804 RepID=A0A160SWQ1_BUCTT|nr:proton-conducting transporter membrane subunit [Buchnera aphidicola]CUR53100.1 NADH-quinone oxidoreductase subunit N [Buchnera aphidicola (Tuberolachnus salignus)]